MEPRTVTIKEASYRDRCAFRRSQGERNVGGPQERLKVVYEDIQGVRTTIELSYDALMDLSNLMNDQMADIIGDKVIDKFLQISDEGGLPQLLFDATGMIPESWKEEPETE
jgi:hypothetical protein